MAKVHHHQLKYSTKSHVSSGDRKLLNYGTDRKISKVRICNEEVTIESSSQEISPAERRFSAAKKSPCHSRSLYVDEERTAWYVLIAPLDDQLVVAPFVNDVVDAVLLLADVLDEDFLAGDVASKYADHQDVVA